MAVVCPNPDCECGEYEVIKRQTTKHPEYGLLTIELRQCRQCFRRYGVASDGMREFHWPLP